jgi:hypothetical protein
MPLFYLRGLTSASHTDSANRHLARYLAFIAGAANAGGFLAIHQYTSHMSGIVASTADNLATGNIWLGLDGLGRYWRFYRAPMSAPHSSAGRKSEGCSAATHCHSSRKLHS